MASIFNALNIGYSGLNASQVAINTTGHNISNAETEGYTRQRVVTQSTYPMHITPGLRGNGTQISEITRIFDNFVYNRYTDASQQQKYSDQMRKTLEELSSYFPDMDEVGIKSDMYEYFNLWQSLADNPDSNAIKITLAQQAQTMTQHISQTREQIFTLQKSLNDQLEVAIDEVNRIGRDIAAINRDIETAEAGGGNNANDLRDQRNVLEKALSDLIGADVFETNVQSNMAVDSDKAIPQGSYSAHINGVNLVDGTTFHPIKFITKDSKDGFGTLYYERQDGALYSLSEQINGGKVGALLQLRGSKVDKDTGEFSDGILQESLSGLDALAAGIISHTNNIYAGSPVNNMVSNPVFVDSTRALVNTDLDISEGNFDVIVYDEAGVEVARRNIVINKSTTIEVPFDNLADGTGNSIRDQLSAIKDDNKDNNAQNDIDDYLSLFNDPANSGQMTFQLNAQAVSQGFTFAIADAADPDKTNFAGATGLSRFFDGSSAKDISLSNTLKADPSKISASSNSVTGNADIAYSIVQLQFERIGFTYKGAEFKDTFYSFYDNVVSDIGSQTNSAISYNDTKMAQYNAILMEYESVSKVSIDEEMTNLIKYQTAYGAAAKIISTIDQMMDTLLGLKS